MKKVQYGLLAVFSALALTACGDDVTKVYEDGEFSSVTSLKDSECTEENEGAIIYSTEDKGMYACADGEWTAIAGKDSPLFRCETKTLKDSSGIAIYCDGDSIGVVKNGKAGAAGKVGAAGKDGVGIDGASCTVADTVDAKTKAVLGYKLICADSLMGIVWNGAAGESGSSCTVADSVNAKTKAVVGFKLMCADTLAGFVKNGVDGLPGEAGTSCVIDSATADSVWIACGEEVAAIALPGAGAKTYSHKVTMALPLPEGMVADMVEIAPQTKITVMGLDKDWEPNGQVFVSDMNYDVTKFGVPVLPSSMGGNFANFAVTGTVEATVSNPYVLIQVECQLFIFDYDGEALKMVYHAYADLSDSESPLVVSYLTDVKAPRVKKLVTGGMSFDKAMEQADKELYKAYGMDYKGRVESLFEGTALDYDLAWMFYMELIPTFEVPPYIMNVGELTARMKALFAENGDFNTPISYDGIVAKTALGMVSESMLPVDMVVGMGPGSGSDSSFMNFVSRMLEQEYDLGSCEGVKKDTIAFSKVGGGLYSDTAFVCLAGVNLWTFASFEDVNRLLGDEEETFGKCSSDNEWEVNTKLYLKRCEKDANGKYDWKPAGDLEKYDLGYCQSDDEGKFVALPYDEYYICHDRQWEYIDESQVLDGVLCNSKTKQDSIYALNGDVYACGDSLNGNNDTVYYWFAVLEVPNIYGEIAFGECTEELYGVVKSYSAYGFTDYLVCNAEQKWEISSNLGICDASKVGAYREVHSNDGMTYYENLKCANQGTAEEPYYSWGPASDIDVEVGFPCTSVKNGFDEETATYTYGGSRYYCNAETGEWYDYEYGFRSGYDGGCTDYLNPATGKAFAIGESVKFGTETLVCDSDSSWYSLSADEIAMGFPCTSVDDSEYDDGSDHYAARQYNGDYYYCNAKNGRWYHEISSIACTSMYNPFSEKTEKTFSVDGGIGYGGSIYYCTSSGEWE